MSRAPAAMLTCVRMSDGLSAHVTMAVRCDDRMKLQLIATDEQSRGHFRGLELRLMDQTNGSRGGGRELLLGRTLMKDVN